MAPATKERQGRAQKFNSIGEVGRLTGVQPPKNVPRDSTGLERPSAFFDSDSPRVNNNYSSPNKSAHKGASRRSEGGQRGRERPDMHAEIGEVGRKTGIVRPPMERDAQGYENPDDFFASSPHSNVQHSGGNRARANGPPHRNGASSSQNRRQTMQEDDQEQEENDVEDGNDMDEDSRGGHYATTPRALKANELNTSINRPRSLQNRSVPRNSAAKSRPSSSRSGNRSTMSGGRTSTEFDEEEIPMNDEESEVEEQSDSEDIPRPRNARLSKLSMSTTNGTAKSARSTMVPSPSSAGSRSTSRRESFGTPTASMGKDKGKGKLLDSPEPEEEEPMYFPNDDYGGGDDQEELQNIQEESGEDGPVEENGEMQEEEDSEEEEEIVVVKPKPKAKQPAKRQREETVDPDGVRRSSRRKLEPLDYWRNERVIYERRQSGIAIRNVVRIPKEAVLAKKHVKSNSRARSERLKSEVDEEEGVDDMTSPDGVVWNWEADTEVTRRVAFTAKMIQPQPTYNGKFMFQKIFTELDYLASGILQIPAGTEKPSKPAKDNSYVFYCIEGAVSVVVHRTRFAIGPGATFFVPRGNVYSITATSNRDVKLFFTQGRRVMESPDGSSRPDMIEDHRQPSEEEEEEEEEGEEEVGDESE